MSAAEPRPEQANERGWVMITNIQHLPDLVRALPDLPGVYLMKDAAGTVIYVGKAVNLRNRVRSYFQAPEGQPPKTRQLVARIVDFEYIVCDSESEALILENTLIKRYQPKYNVLLKDDKTYPYLKININEPWPQVFITRRVENDGARYFGPYADTGSVRRTMELVKRLFPYRSCTKPITGTDERPCLDFHIHRCLGPCIGAVDAEEYGKVIRQVILFLEGKQEQVVADLKAQMEAAAENLEFERAAFLRDQVRSVERVMERQKLVVALAGDQDAIAFTQEENECCVQVFFIRGGKLFGREHFMMQGVQDEDPTHIMTEFVQQFYDKAPNIPPTIFLQHPLENPAIIEKWLSERAGHKVETRVPQRGDRKKLIDMVAENARQTLRQLRVKWLADQGKTAAALEELREALSLPRLPRRMECYDISSIQGTSKVGSMVVFQDGRPRTSDYRRFRIKDVEGNNDYAAMQEMLRRRFKRAGFQARLPIGASGMGAAIPEPDAELEADEVDSLKPDPLNPEAEAAALALDASVEDGDEMSVSSAQTGWEMPDLLVIDGGRGHLNAALEVMRELGVHFVPICSLAKQNEEIYLPDVPEPVVLPRDAQGLYLMQRIRDEAHRFAITYHRNVRSKAQVKSALDEVPGIGPTKKKALVRKFGSVAGIKKATIDELMQVQGITMKLAVRIKELL